MSAYKKHIFVCENRRDDGRACCAAGGDMIDGGAVKFLRQQLKAAGLHGKGKMRVNRAGCFDRCADGPALVIYPQGVWYRYESENDLREIAQKAIAGDDDIPRLRI